MTTITASTEAHPRFLERWTEVYYDNLRARNLKLIGGATFLMLVLMAGAFTHSRFLDVDEVRVIGANALAADDVRAQAGIDLGTPLVRLDLDAAASQLSELPRIAGVTATREWNGTVTLQVVEREPVVQFRSGSDVIRAAADGVVVDVASRELADVPVVIGAKFNSEPGWQVPTEVADALAVAEALPPDVASVVDAVSLSVGALHLDLVGGGIVDMGDARDLDDKFLAVRSILSSVELQCLSVLDVRASNVPVVTRKLSCTP